jgi:hypothetical protein
MSDLKSFSFGTRPRKTVVLSPTPIYLIYLLPLQKITHTMEKKKDLSGLLVKDGRLLNFQPDGQNLIKKISHMKKEMKINEKVNTILRAEQIKKMF